MPEEAPVERPGPGTCREHGRTGPAAGASPGAAKLEPLWSSGPEEALNQGGESTHVGSGV